MTGRGEAGPMVEFAGVDALQEHQARTTKENASYSFEMLGDVPVTVVTQWWHIPRAMRHFRRHFSTVTAAPVWEAHVGALREIVAFAAHLTGRA